MPDTYTVGIIGAGRIGCGFDAPDSSRILTHAHAVTANPHFSLAAIVDPDTEKGEREAARWGTRFFADTDAMLDSVQPDVVVIASPDATHAALLSKVSLHDPKLMICEKPVASSRSEDADVQGIGTPVIVNFSRRFDPTMVDIRTRLRAGEFGTVLTASGVYTRGVVHNGSHLIDMARYLFGEVTSVTAVPPGVPDYPLGADSIAAALSFEGCDRFFLMPADARVYAVFEMDILTERARIRFTNECRTLILQDVVDDPVYAGYRMLGDERVSGTGLLDSLPHLYEHAIGVLEKRETIRSSLASALATNAACLSIVESLERR